MFRLFVRSILLTVVLTALLFLVRGIGGQVKNPLVNMFTETTRPDGQMQVCWHGICPGLTTLDTAVKILNSDISLAERSTTGRLCWRDPQKFASVCLDVRDGQIDRLYLYPSFEAEQTIRLGDVVTWWGVPVKSSIGPECPVSASLFSNNILTFTHDLSILSHNDNTITFKLEARSRINAFEISASVTDINTSDLTDWRGFTSISAPQGGCGS